MMEERGLVRVFNSQTLRCFDNVCEGEYGSVPLSQRMEVHPGRHDAGFVPTTGVQNKPGRCKSKGGRTRPASVTMAEMQRFGVMSKAGL